MNRKFLPVWIVFPGLLFGLSATSLPGQATGQTNASVQQTTGQAAPTPELKMSPLKALQNFEPAEGAEYELGPGDDLTLEFPGRPELATSKVTVGPDGRITIPIAGSIKVSDLTRSLASKAIIDALAPYYKDVTVTISIDKYGSNRIIVLGNVQHPGVLYFDGTPTLLDAIARGGLMANSGSTTASGNLGASRDGIPDRVAIYRGNDQVVWVDLKALLQGGSGLADLRLKRNDIVFVPAQQEVFVSVLGAVIHPGAVALTSQSTLASVIAQAGGMAEGAGKNIQIVEHSSGKTVTIPFKSLLTPQGTDEVELHTGDVIFVPQSGWYKTTYVFQRLSPVMTMGSIAALAVAP
jgi:polysaccharide biosynthesis/export protein